MPTPPFPQQMPYSTPPVTPNLGFKACEEFEVLGFLKDPVSVSIGCSHHHLVKGCGAQGQRLCEVQGFMEGSGELEKGDSTHFPSHLPRASHLEPLLPCLSLRSCVSRLS